MKSGEDLSADNRSLAGQKDFVKDIESVGQ